LSEEKEIDAVLINANSNPMVVRLVDYSQFRYKQQKKLKEIKKKQHIVKIKEIQINPNIDINDLNVKVKQAFTFLTKGNKVKFFMRFRGRMIHNSSILSEEIFQKVIDKLKDVGCLDMKPKMEGNRMIAILIPKK
jgi:translation initiation factor IF-3